MTVATKTRCRTTDYAKRVASGKITAGRLVRLACRRHLADLKRDRRQVRFDRAAADHAIEFFERYLRLPEGDRPFVLSPWQAFIVGSLFGWKGADGFRRFRTAYIEGAKGCGKSPLSGGIGLYCLVADGELAAEIYPAANTREQAGITFRDAKNMAQASPALRDRLKIEQANIAYLPTSSFMRPVSSEHRGLDGKRVHCGLIDEIHEHASSLVVDKIRAGTKGRNQALIIEITNSGHDRTTICWQHHHYSDQVLEGILTDDSWFAYVCTLDPCKKCLAAGKTQPVDDCRDCDDWRDEKVWIKTNPNLGVSVSTKYLREQVREAEGMPAKQNIVKRLNFCLWTEQAERVIPMDRWDAGGRKKVDLAELAGRTVYAGLDIGATSDFTALALVFPHDDVDQVERPIDPLKPELGTRTVPRRSYTLMSYFWLPEVTPKRDLQLADLVGQWRREGWIRTTPGNVVDYDQVLEDLLAITREFNLAGLGFDRGFQGSQMGNNLQKHLGELVKQVPQGIITMNAPFRELLELLLAGRIHHDGNPVLRWMASNTAAEIRGGLMKPSKERSAEKIDGITATVMALAVAMSEPPPFKSYYENNPVEFI